MVQHAVCGFYVSTNGSILLLQKKFPSFQNGLLNGVGGKMEENETPIEAMNREWLEETGYSGGNQSWKEFCIIEINGWKIHFFKANGHSFNAPKFNDVGEKFIWYDMSPASDIYWGRKKNLMENLFWLIPLAFCDSFINNSKVEIIAD